STPRSPVAMAAESARSPTSASPPASRIASALPGLRTSARNFAFAAARCRTSSAPTFPVAPVTRIMGRTKCSAGGLGAGVAVGIAAGRSLTLSDRIGVEALRARLGLLRGLVGAVDDVAEAFRVALGHLPRGEEGQAFFGLHLLRRPLGDRLAEDLRPVGE